MSDLFRLQSIFRDVFSDPQLVLTEDISPRTRPDWDSIVMVHIILAVEAEFGLRFSTDEVASFSSVGDILRALDRRR